MTYIRLRAGCIVALAFLSGFVRSTWGQQVLLSERFNIEWSTSQPPPGWQIYLDGDTSSNDWHRAPDLGPNPWSDNPTPYALLDSGRFEQNNDSLITPPMDCSQFSVVSLRCSTYFQGGFSPYTAMILGSIGGGPFEHIVADYNGMRIGPELQIFNLAWAAGQRSVRLAWVMVGPSQVVPYWAVDDVSVIGQSTTSDVGCVAILAPGGTLDSGDAVVPRSVVQNFGAAEVSFDANFFIGTSYRQTMQVQNLGPGGVDTIDFPQWSAAPRGLLPAYCFTVLPGDTNASNDRRDTAVTVRVADVAAVTIVSPRDTVDSNALIPVMARVRNPGTEPASFYAYVRITDWRDSVYVDALQPGDERDLSFGEWVANTAGICAAVCSTAWGQDRYAMNDTVTRRFFVRSPNYRDVGAVQVLVPASMVRESAFLAPTGVIRNNGLLGTDLMAYFTIDFQGFPAYLDSLPVSIGGSRVDTIAFREWQALPSGDFVAYLRVAMSGDADSTNNLVTKPFQVQQGYHDVGAARIIAPKDTMQAGVVTPSAWVKNYGSFPESFVARMRIMHGGAVSYSDSVTVAALAPAESSRVLFRQWSATSGSYSVRCSTLLAGDIVGWNDLAQAGLYVESISVPAGWREVRSVPKTPSGKDVKNGGGLTRVAGSGYVYALKGNKTPDFYRYDATRDSWRAMLQIPAGPEEKPVGKGGALCNDGNRYIYATKGNSTYGFWRYDVAMDSWRALQDVPGGPSGKAVKGGTSMAYVNKAGTGYVYLLKGYKNEFYRFNTATARWESLAAAPLGTSGKNSYKDGSFIVYDEQSIAYVAKASYNEFFAYRTTSDSWSSRTYKPYPYGIKNKKLKDGGCATWYNGRLFSLKGGNTQEFWVFNPALDSWLALDTVPAYGSTLKKKKVKGGAGLVSIGSNMFLATKGNKTVEFWRYKLPGGSTPVEEQTTQPSPRSAVRVRPNPVRDLAFVDLVRPATVKVFDSRGGLVLSLESSGGRELLDCRSLTTGVYFVTVSQMGSRSSGLLVKD